MNIWGKTFSRRALVSVIAIVLSLGALIYTRSIALRVFTTRGPTVVTSAKMLSGIRGSTTSLRGWILLGDSVFQKEREQAWKEEIDPALKQLQSLSEQWDNPKNITRLSEISNILEEFRFIQWWIEDVAHTPGNRPAHAIYEKRVRPAGRRAMSAITAMIDLEKMNQGGQLPTLADFRAALALSEIYLERYLDDGARNNRDAHDHQISTARDRMEGIGLRTELLDRGQIDQLGRLKFEFDAFDRYAAQSIEASDRVDSNVALHLLGHEAHPLSERMVELLQAMTENQQHLMKADSSRLTVATTLAFTLMVLTIVLMVSYGRREPSQ